MAKEHLADMGRALLRSENGKREIGSDGTRPVVRGASADASVRVDQVSKVYYGRTEVAALIDVTLAISAGEMAALVGPSGCGKSTLLNLMGCMDIPTSGAVRIEGSTTSSLRDEELTRLRRDRVGTVFQFFNLLPALSVRDNVALPLVLQRRDQREVEERVSCVLEVVGMKHKAEEFPPNLSGGESQRVAVARAVVHEPAIVLADEPTGNLDSKNAEAVLKLLRESASRGQAIVLATHSHEAAALCDREIRLEGGRVVG